MIYKTLHASTENVDFNLNFGGFITEMLSTMNIFINNLFPLIALIIGLVLAFWILTEIIKFFTTIKEEKKGVNDDYIKFDEAKISGDLDKNYDEWDPEEKEENLPSYLK